VRPRTPLALAVAAACGVTVAALARAGSPAPAITGLEGHVAFTRADETLRSTSSPPSASIAITASGGKILFTRAGGKFGDETIFTASADGTNQRRITPFGAQCCPRWSPDGSRIIISAAAPDGKRITTGIIDQDGSQERKIPLPKNTLNLGPGIWSRDGTRIGFEGWSDDRAGMQGIYVARASDGKGLVRVTKCSKVQDDRTTDFSPDGSKIFFFRTVRRFPRVTDEPLGSLFVVNVDGTELRRVTPRNMQVEVVGNAGGRLSRDGRWIVFTSAGVIWTIHPDGSGLTKVLHDRRGRLAITPTWSPDDRLILFGLDPPGTRSVVNAAPPNTLYVIRPDGTGLTPLVTSRDWKREPDWTAAR
jgi:Tol biopolymer transport system component